MRASDHGVFSLVLGCLLVVGVAAVLAACLLATHIVVLGIPFSAALAPPSVSYIAAMAALITGVIAAVQPARPTPRIMFLSALLVVFGALNAVDLTFLHYFRQPTIVLFPHLPRSDAGAGTVFAYLAYVRHYLPPSYWIYSLLLGVPAFLALHMIGFRTGHLRFAALGACAVGLAGLNAPSYPAPASVDAREPMASRILSIDPAVPRKRLQPVDRAGSLALLEAPKFKPRTIVIVVNENTSYFNRSSDNKQSLIDRIVALSGERSSWNIYHNAVTNSNCTDVSLPSIFTGSGSHESFDKLHRMPFLFDIAKARGYRTAFYSSAFMEWARLSVFLSKAQIDSGLTASETGLPLTNDLAVDDIPVMKRLQAFIRAQPAEDHLFIVTYMQALHTPYQSEGDLEFPPGLKDRRSRALHVIETDHRMLFDALREAGRLADALIILTADHGEPINSPATLIPRIENFGEETLRIPLLIKEPANLPADLAARLRAAQSGLVSNLDIAPTIADLLGVRPDAGLSYSGLSLLGKIPSDRLSVAVSVTEWRPWPRAAVALVRQGERFVCHHGKSCEFHRSSPAEDAAITPEGRAAKFSFYMNEALKLPIVNQGISRIYHAHWGKTWSPPPR